mmetsp:Transcript_120958/g.342185  ORF Transcript_120958/g.342185 Transcript_120958/m.342185 type:complete len:275 (-) Transcript_120958:585-1409(-)
MQAADARSGQPARVRAVGVLVVFRRAPDQCPVSCGPSRIETRMEATHVVWRESPRQWPALQQPRKRPFVEQYDLSRARSCRRKDMFLLRMALEGIDGCARYCYIRVEEVGKTGLRLAAEVYYVKAARSGKDHLGVRGPGCDAQASTAVADMYVPAVLSATLDAPKAHHLIAVQSGEFAFEMWADAKATHGAARPEDLFKLWCAPSRASRGSMRTRRARHKDLASAHGIQKTIRAFTHAKLQSMPRQVEVCAARPLVAGGGIKRKGIQRIAMQSP